MGAREEAMKGGKEVSDTSRRNIAVSAVSLQGEEFARLSKTFRRFSRVSLLTECTSLIWFIRVKKSK